MNWWQQSQERSGISPRRNVWDALTILRDVCKCAFNAEDNIWYLFWKEHKNYANWLRWLKLCGQIIHRLKFELTKFEEIWWTYVGLMNIFMGSVFFGSPCMTLIFVLTKYALVVGMFSFLVVVPCLPLDALEFEACVGHPQGRRQQHVGGTWNMSLSLQGRHTSGSYMSSAVAQG